MDRLLITGGSGFVGKNLAGFFSPRYSVATTFFQHPGGPAADSLHLDIRNPDAVLEVFGRVAPTTVIHAAGQKNVRFCEEDPAEAHRINALGTQNVARACREVGAHLIYISTDLVFAGVRGNYEEDEVPKPNLVYGRSKLEGERLAREELPSVAVCRSGGIYGLGSPLLSWFTKEIDAGRSVECLVDVFNTPTYAPNLGEMTEVVMRRRLSGIFHTVGSQRVSRFDLFSSYANSRGIDPSLLKQVSLTQMKESLWLQPDSSLSSEKTTGQLGIHFDSVDEGFARLKAEGGL
ncbi:MAG TPA: SDR family oxidoreductase [Pyrinomonadaceae bacterium]|nr:SDR family oxidoreductase [Pyrinomonadaceae bacterium]